VRAAVAAFVRISVDCVLKSSHTVNIRPVPFNCPLEIPATRQKLPVG
jgi:hypothetical protein